MLSGLQLESTLRSIVQAAVELVDAPDGRIPRFVHGGIDGGTRAGMGPLPEGKGLLGQLIVEPRPLRLVDLGTHRASVRFPRHAVRAGRPGGWHPAALAGPVGLTG
jgi:hypothetical protein